MSSEQHSTEHQDQHEASRSPFTATGRTLGWGVVSTGTIARKVTPDITGMEDARLVAVSSRTPKSAEEFARDFGAEKAHGGPDGMERMFADPEVDVVYVATPHGQHHEHVMAALAAGKHVVCEKAFMMTTAQAEEVIELAREKGLFLMEGLWTRFHPLRARVQEVLDSGEIGTPRWAQADLGFRGPTDQEHRLWRVDAGGGALLDLGCYVLHWPWLALGKPLGLTAQTVKRGSVDAMTQVTTTHENGVSQLSLSLVSQGPRRAVISGHEGFIDISAPMHKAQAFTVTDALGNTREEKVPMEGIGYVYEMREATRCIQQGLCESPIMPWQDSLDQMRFFDEVRAQIGVRYPEHDGE